MTSVRAVMSPRIVWPDGKSFAFTIFDDTDDASLPDIKLVYDLLADLGFKTTKSVWPIKGNQPPLIGGTTCENAECLAWILRLQESGFEIGLHNITFHTSSREETIEELIASGNYSGMIHIPLRTILDAMKASIGVIQG